MRGSGMLAASRLVAGLRRVERVAGTDGEQDGRRCTTVKTCNRGQMMSSCTGSFSVLPVGLTMV